MKYQLIHYTRPDIGIIVIVKYIKSFEYDHTQKLGRKIKVFKDFMNFFGLDSTEISYGKEHILAESNSIKELEELALLELL